MPKIRKKQTFKTIDGYRKKSGSLTRVFRKTFKKENSSYNFFLSQKNHRRYAGFSENTFYIDDYTPEFIELDAIPTFSLDSKYLKRNNLLHTPNEFTFNDDKITKTLKASDFNGVINENYIDSKNQTYYENTCLIKEDLLHKKDFVKINLKFNETCQLSFNKLGSEISKTTTNTSDSESNKVTINNTDFTPTNSPVAYFNFEENTWDYLGNISNDYYDSISDFLDAPVAFNSIKTNKQSPPIKSQNVGHPVNNLGFPFDKKFKGMNRHLLKMSEFIDAPFLIKDIKINFIGSSYAEVNSPYQCEVLNSLNFFILNQRRNLNEDSFDQINKSSKIIYYYDENNNFSNSTINYEVNGNTLFSNIENHNLSNENIYVYLSSKNQVEKDESSASVRELVGYSSLVNFNPGSLTDLNVDIEAIKSSADIFIEGEENNNDNVFSNCNYKNKNIIMKCNVSVPTSQTCEEMSMFSFKGESEFLNRTGCNYRTERSEFRDVYSGDNIDFTYDDYRLHTYGISKESTKENGYFVQPSDTLLLGVSFNPNMDITESNNYGKDVYLLHDNIEIVLIGEYRRNNSPIRVIEESILENKNIKSIKNNKNVFDDTGINIPYLNKGAYFDLKPTYERQEFFGITQNILTWKSTISDADVATNRTFIQTSKLVFEEENVIDENKKMTKDYKLLSFGKLSDCLHYTTSYASLISNNSTFYVEKEFKNDFYEDIEPTKTNNIDRHSRLENIYFVEN